MSDCGKHGWSHQTQICPGCMADVQQMQLNNPFLGGAMSDTPRVDATNHNFPCMLSLACQLERELAGWFKSHRILETQIRQLEEEIARMKKLPSVPKDWKYIGPSCLELSGNEAQQVTSDGQAIPDTPTGAS